MPGRAEKLGHLDDRSVVYRADDPEQRIAWRRLLVSCALGSLLAAAVLYVTSQVAPEPYNSLILLAIAVPLIAAYCVWRRRRNRRLTGSPTTWPSP
jgi:O-antigen/teichoic acid export membrane protein